MPLPSHPTKLLVRSQYGTVIRPWALEGHKSPLLVTC